MSRQEYPDSSIDRLIEVVRAILAHDEQSETRWLPPLMRQEAVAAIAQAKDTLY